MQKLHSAKDKILNTGAGVTVLMKTGENIHIPPVVLRIRPPGPLAPSGLATHCEEVGGSMFVYLSSW